MGGKSGGGSAAPSTTTQYVREAPEIEAFKLGLLEAGKDLAQRPITLPVQQIAGQSPYQMAAYDRMAQMMGGVGAYAPMAGVPFQFQAPQAARGGFLGGMQAAPQRGAFGGLRTGPGTPFPNAQTIGQPGTTGAGMMSGIDPARGGVGPAPIQAQAAYQAPVYGYRPKQVLGPFGYMDGPQERYLVSPGTGSEPMAQESAIPLESLQPALSAASGPQAIDVPNIQPGISAYEQLIRQGAQTAQQGAGAALGALGGAQPYQAAAREALMSSMANIPGQIMPAQQNMAQSAQFGQGATAAGIGSLTGAAAQFSPESIRGFMSPYEDAAVQSALGDIARQGQVQREQLRGQAAQAGAFGGSRQAVAESELGRNVLERQGQIAAEMRRVGYQDAAQRAAQAFEQARGRQIQAAGQMGQLGGAGGQLGVSAA